MSLDDELIGIETTNVGNLVLVGNKFNFIFVPKDTGVMDPNNLVNPTFSASATRIKKDGSGNILIAGSSDSKMSLTRFDPANLPPTLTLSQFGPGTVNAIAFNASGKILLAGTNGSQLAVSRLNTNLGLDTTFGSSGLITDTISTEAKDIEVDSAGQILIVGTSSNQMLIKRYQSNGSFINDGNHLKTVSFTQGNSVTNRIILDGIQLVLGGIAGTSQAMARLWP
jgi:hypothetical protein